MEAINYGEEEGGIVLQRSEGKVWGGGVEDH